MIRGGTILFFVSLIAGLFFLNLGFNFIPLPDFLTSNMKWANIIGGVLLIIGGIFSMKTTPSMVRRY